jgi:hypothetical protein
MKNKDKIFFIFGLLRCCLRVETGLSLRGLLMMEYKSKDTYEHPLLSFGVATLPKNVHSLWCSHPNITGLAATSKHP